MVKVLIVNNLKKDYKIVSESTTLRAVLKDGGVDYSRGTTNLDGSPLVPGDLDKSFADFGIKEECVLSSIVKADNA